MGQARHDWYLKEWCAVLDRTQADIVRDLEWNKARVSLMWRGKQPYTRDAVNELAAYLNLHPYELLMDPQDAMAIRRLRQAAMRIVEGDVSKRDTDDDKDAPPRLAVVQ